jgi:hypothetical protein
MYTAEFDQLAGLFRKIEVGTAAFLDGEIHESGQELLRMALGEFQVMLNEMMFNELDRHARGYVPPVPLTPEEEQKALNVAAGNGRA